MKIIYCISNFLFLSFVANAQLQTGFHYKIKNNQTIYYTTDNGATSIKKMIAGKKLKANITQDNATLKLDFWAIKPITDKYNGSATIINSSDVLGSSSYYYLSIDKRMSMSKPTSYISLSYATWEVGATVIPFKYRFGSKKDTIPNDGSTNINAGIYVGRKWGATRYYEDKNRMTNSWAFTLGGFISPTVIALSPDNTKKEVTTKSNEFGLSYGLAFLTSYRDINFGVLTGIETPLSGDARHWIYANRPWLGFGIGYKLGIFGGK